METSIFGQIVILQEFFLMKEAGGGCGGNANSNGRTATRYCGLFFNPNVGAMVNVPVCGETSLLQHMHVTHVCIYCCPHSFLP
jgi:hypothetical protein